MGDSGVGTAELAHLDLSATRPAHRRAEGHAEERPARAASPPRARPRDDALARQFTAEWIATLAALFVVGALVAWALVDARSSLEATEIDRLRVQARVVDDNVGQQLEGIHRGLSSVRHEYANTPPHGVSTLISYRLKSLTDAIPGVRSMRLVDADGNVLASSVDAELGRDESARDWFRAARAANDPTALHVARPGRDGGERAAGAQPGREAGERPTVVFARAIPGVRAEFGGAVAADLDPGYFEVLLRSVVYAPDMRARLGLAGSAAFAEMPRPSVPPERTTTADSLPLASDDVASIVVEVVDGDDGRRSRRLLASRAIAPAELHMDRPLVVAVGRGEDELFAPWRAQALAYGAFCVLLAVGATLGLHRGQVRRRSYAALQASTADERQRTAEQLELALQGADLGLWDWDIGADRFTHNDVATRRLGYAAGELSDATTDWGHLIHAEDRPALDASVRAHFKRQTPAYECEFRVRHRDGRWIWLLSRGQVVERSAEGRPLRMAGTHMDITEKKTTALELQRLNDELRRLSTIDPLTEVGNRRLFDQTLRVEWQRAARRGAPVALLMIDVDHFKDYNDHYGHPAGDACLRQIARMIGESVRRGGELVARYGGEEFALLLPGADLAAALAIAERCKARIADAKIEHRASTTSAWLGVSIGVASQTASAEVDCAALVEIADAALYRAKRCGRGRIES